MAEAAVAAIADTGVEAALAARPLWLSWQLMDVLAAFSFKAVVAEAAVAKAAVAEG